MNDLMNPFGQLKSAQVSTRLKFRLLHQISLDLGHLVKSKNLKLSIIVHSNLKKTVCSVLVFSALCVIMNAYAVSING